MRGDLVALDLETTGLDVEKDSIIEIGVVRIRDGQVIEEFGTLVNPGFVIPAETTHITGIHQDDLRHAPLLIQALPQIAEFVGNAPVIAHNAAFDIGFMRRFNTLKQNLPIDTYELASILLPRTPRYSLASLAELFGINLENAHRALDDARATAILYWHLWGKTLELPNHILQELVRAMQPFTWETGEVFRAALQEKYHLPDDEPENIINVFTPIQEELKPLHPNDALAPLDLDEINAVLDADGSLAKVIAGYEHRQQQIEMAVQVGNAFNTQQHLLIEAGTGTGKSLAYLVPAIKWAVKNNRRVVVSTNTINLQDQLINNDVPLLRQALNTDFNAAVMKGRSNYLCPRRLAAVRRRLPANIDEFRTMAKVIVWLQESQTGDKGEISLRAREFFIWNRLSAEDEDCTLHRCQSQMDGTCPYFKARKRAESTHLLITNHALLVSDAASENRVLPDYKYLIVDEAHQLEDAITNGLSFRIDRTTLLRRLNDIGGVTGGLLGDLLQSARKSVPDKHVMKLEVFIQDVGTTVRAMNPLVNGFYNAVVQYLSDSNNSHNPRLRLDDKMRSHGAFSHLQSAWDDANETFEIVIEAMAQLANAISKLEKYEIPGFDDHVNATAAASSNLQQIRSGIQALVHQPDANTVYWINNNENPEYVSVQSAPLHIGPMMEEYIWHNKESVVLTSATLRTAGNFTYLRDRLYADKVQEVAVGSPFDYKQSTLVYIPDDLPQPQDSGYQKAVEKGIVELAAELGGRVLALFTSYAQLRETAANISPRLALGNIVVYDQATGGSREALLDSFKSSEKAVLLGTRSFWEGIDIPGDDLVALVIVRLPFAVPSDPIFAARSSTYKDAFNDYAVPDAILRFRQGFGRLIRTRSDTGIVTVFDSRIVSKSYGTKFLESLPDVTLQYGQLNNLPRAATNWLNRTPEKSE
jgi:ATP-dependent DNA helicase DinG